LIGAGKLIKEILPWLINKTPKTTVHCRRVSQGQELKKEFPAIHVAHWGARLNGGQELQSAWVVAAPIEAREINKFFKNTKSINAVVDLRDNSDTDPLKIENVEVLKLKDFFNQIEGAQAEVQTRANEAKEVIAGLVLKRLQAVEIRPFGWEDLCG
jgi:glutamyl-tRNA reductase